ncbi:hypothetical protein M513_09104 [Trichuris suis]|uniref:Uncharacterized protein n=1 Tax=Trichuris suis TaxID=68888 RepID=A0A085LYG5_9BILA|nr:hypothetical protein M513_09104 [Trichuris suis]
MQCFNLPARGTTSCVKSTVPVWRPLLTRRGGLSAVFGEKRRQLRRTRRRGDGDLRQCRTMGR